MQSLRNDKEALEKQLSLEQVTKDGLKKEVLQITNQQKGKNMEVKNEISTKNSEIIKLNKEVERLDGLFKQATLELKMINE